MLTKKIKYYYFCVVKFLGHSHLSFHAPAEGESFKFNQTKGQLVTSNHCQHFSKFNLFYLGIYHIVY